MKDGLYKGLMVFFNLTLVPWMAIACWLQVYGIAESAMESNIQGVLLSMVLLGLNYALLHLNMTTCREWILESTHSYEVLI